MNRLYKNTMVLIAALFLGLTLTIQFKSSQEQVGIVTSETVPQLENELHNISSEVEGLRAAVNRFEKQGKGIRKGHGRAGRT